MVVTDHSCGEGWTARGTSEYLEGRELFNTSIVVVVTLLYTLVKLIELSTKKGEFYCIIIT